MKNVIWDDCPGLEISTLKIMRQNTTDLGYHSGIFSQMKA